MTRTYPFVVHVQSAQPPPSAANEATAHGTSIECSALSPQEWAAWVAALREAAGQPSEGEALAMQALAMATEPEAPVRVAFCDGSGGGVVDKDEGSRVRVRLGGASKSWGVDGAIRSDGLTVWRRRYQLIFL